MSMTKNGYDIALMPGDGIGPEVTEAAVAVMSDAAARRSLMLNLHDGRGAPVTTGRPWRRSRQPPWKCNRSSRCRTARRYGVAIFPLSGAAPRLHRKSTCASTTACSQPAPLPPPVSRCAYRVRADKVDMSVIRELTEGALQVATIRRAEATTSASDRLTIRATSEKLFEVAFAQAKPRRRRHDTPGHVTLLDKSNVLRSNAFLRKVFDEEARDIPISVRLAFTSMPVQ